MVRANFYLRNQPFVLQISIKLTTFSCLSSCRILISLRAVIGNWKKAATRKVLNDKSSVRRWLLNNKRIIDSHYHSGVRQRWGRPHATLLNLLVAWSKHIIAITDDLVSIILGVSFEVQTVSSSVPESRITKQYVWKKRITFPRLLQQMLETVEYYPQDK